MHIRILSTTALLIFGTFCTIYGAECPPIAMAAKPATATISLIRPAFFVSYSPDGKTLIGGTDSLRFWNKSNQLIRAVDNHSNEDYGGVVRFSIRADGRVLAATDQKIIKIWNVGNGALIRAFEQRDRGIRGLAYSPDGTNIAIAGDDQHVTKVGQKFVPTFPGVLKILDAQSGDAVHTLVGHTGPVNAVIYSPDGQVVISAGDDGEIKLWNSSTGTLLQTLKGSNEAVTKLCLNPAENSFSSASDHDVKIWDTASGKLLRAIDGITSTSRICAIAYSPDGKALAISCDDGSLGVWDTTTGVFLCSLAKSGPNSLQTLSYCPDGRTIAGGYCLGGQNKEKHYRKGGALDAGEIKIWSVQDDDQLKNFVSKVSDEEREKIVSERAEKIEAALIKAQADTDAKRRAQALLIQPQVDPNATKFSIVKAEPSKVNKATRPETSLPRPDKKQPDRPIQDKWALIIGISKFANPEYNLKYAAKDAQDFYTYLTTEGHFRKDHVLLLLNQNATRRNIMAAFGDKFLPAVTREGDLVTIYVSTHGTPSSRDAGKRNFIVAYDTEADSLYETGVDMDELYRRVKEGVRTDRALIVLDTCYSGAGVPGARGIGEYANFDTDQIAQGFGHLVMTSSANNERSWESKVSTNGVFTKYLLQDLRLTNGDVKSAFNKLKDDVGWEVQNAFNQPQHPQIGGSWEGKELILTASPNAPRAIFNPDLLKLMNLQSSIGPAKR